MSGISTKPYLIRAIFEWCNDSGFSPHLAVTLGAGVEVPREFARDGEIILNISPLATNRLSLGNELIEFQARFGGVAREIRVPIGAVRAIYARENGEGMGFETEAALFPETIPGALSGQDELPEDTQTGVAPEQPVGLRVLNNDNPQTTPPEDPGPGSPKAERPKLTRIK